MKIFCTASKDTYITDKIIDGDIRAEDANVGKAGTLDLFKLYDETKINGSGSQNEISRLLVKFDYQKIHELTGSKIDLSNFTAKIKIFDARSGQATPSNFTLSVLPLSQSFDEGVGRDVTGFDDLDACNFLTASVANGSSAVLWNASGANAIGDLGSATIDVFDRANFNDGSGLALIGGTQTFVEGDEDLFIDVTKIVSATVAGQIKNHGFRIAYSGSEEEDDKTRFVKRFSSRQSSNFNVRPRIEVSFDDSIQDNHANSFFNLTGSLFLNSFSRSESSNLVSGSSLTQITGSNSLLLKLKSGSYSYITTASQHTAGTIDSAGTNFVTGVYSASFAIDLFGSSSLNLYDTMEDFVIKSGSIEFDEFWCSLDENVGFYTGSVTFNKPDNVGGDWTSREPLINITNLNHEYSTADEPRLRLFGRDLVNEQNQPTRVPYSIAPIIFEEVYYRIKDSRSGEVVIDFGESDNSTRVSTDTDGMFFDLHMDVFEKGAPYVLDFLIIDRGQRHVVSSKKHQFTVR